MITWTKFKTYILLATFMWPVGLSASDETFLSLKVAFATRDAELNKPVHVTLTNDKTQTINIPLHNHYLAIELRYLNKKMYEARVKAYVDTDHPKTTTVEQILTLSPGKRTRMYLKGPLIKRAPLELILQHKHLPK